MTNELTTQRPANGQSQNGAKDVVYNVNAEQIEILRQAGIALENPGQVRFRLQTHDSPAVVLSHPMLNKLQTAQILIEQHENDETFETFKRVITGRHYTETLVAITRALNGVLGEIKAVNGGFFSEPPSKIDVVTDVKNGFPFIEQAFVGTFEITALEKAESSVEIKGFDTVVVKIEAKKKFAPIVRQIFAAVDHEVKNSFYIGKQIIVDAGQYGLSFELTEFKLTPGIFLNAADETLVNDLIIDELQTGGKRTYLFTGDIGTGKTETAIRCGLEASRLGMTFFYVKDPAIFNSVLTLSEKYGDVVIFMEDVDAITDDDERTDDLNEWLNLVDGIQTKGREGLRVIFTTNSPEKINHAARRAGRMDLIHWFGNLDTLAKTHVMVFHLGEIPGFEKLDLPALADSTGEMSGSSFTELCKRAAIFGRKQGRITPEIFGNAFGTMKFHLEFVAGNNTKQTPVTFDAAIAAALKPILDKLEEMA